MVYFLLGDELYLEDLDFLENFMFIEKKIEEIMKEGKQFYWIVIYYCYFYDIYVIVQLKYKYVYFKNFVVRKSYLQGV